MERYNSIFQLIAILFLTLFGLDNTNIYAQNARIRRTQTPQNDTLAIRPNAADTMKMDVITPDHMTDSITQTKLATTEKLSAPANTTLLSRQRDSLYNNAASSSLKKRFIPDAKKATWTAIVFPGGGQIYNRKYWKLPIFYGGFVGCAYALHWCNNMYKDYKQAYIDIMDDDPNTRSYENFLPPNYDITGQEAQFQERFKKKKDIFRRQRDLSIFAFIGVYVLSIIDAYVDAELSDFDISHDLGLKIQPTLINHSYGNTSHSIGLQCSIKF